MKTKYAVETTHLDLIHMYRQTTLIVMFQCVCVCVFRLLCVCVCVCLRRDAIADGQYGLSDK